MQYKVKFLSNEEFDELPGENMSTKLGVAYPEKGEAYVRSTGARVVDVFTLAHELEHLEGKHLGEHYDEENKCYYKDWGQTLQAVGPALGFIPGIGPALSIGAQVGGGLRTAQVQSKQNKAQMAAMNQQNQGFGQNIMGQFGSGQQGPNVVQAQGSMGSGMGGSVTGGQGGGINQLFGRYSGR